MSIVKDLNRVICDIEELQDLYAKADANRLMAEVQRDEVSAELTNEREAIKPHSLKCFQYVMANQLRSPLGYEVISAVVDDAVSLRSQLESVRQVGYESAKGLNDTIDTLRAQLAEATKKLAAEMESRQRYQAALHTYETTRDTEIVLELVDETARADKAEQERDEARAEVERPKARKVTLPEIAYRAKMLVGVVASDDGCWYRVDDVKAAIRAAGVECAP